MSAKPYLVVAVALLTVAACGTTRSTTTAPATAAPHASKAPVATQTPVSEPLPNGYDPARNADADIAAAVAKSRLDKRPVLLDFGADWCPDCVALGQDFRTDTVQPVIDRFHVVSVDVGNFDRHLSLARKYDLNLQTSGIPALVVVSSSGTIRTTTSDGSFSNARTMTADQVAAFLKRWQ